MDPARLLSKLTHAHWIAADHEDRQVTIDALLLRLSPAMFEHAPTGARFELNFVDIRDEDDDDHHHHAPAELDASALTDLQREVIACLTGQHPPRANYAARGIPDDPEQRRAALGSAPHLPAGDRDSSSTS